MTLNKAIEEAECITMKAPMTTSDKGIDFIKRWEGSRQEVYLDPIGLPTLGVGHLLSPEELKLFPVGTKLSLEQVNGFLRKDLSKAEFTVSDKVVHDLDQHEFDSLVSFVFNIGEGNFSKSTLLRLLNSGLIEDASKEFSRWIYAKGKILPGLVKRREAEKNLFLKGDYDEPSE